MSTTAVLRVMRRAVLPAALGTGVTLAGVACDDPVGAGGLPPPSFLARPDTVAPGDTFAVVFTLLNPSRDTVTIASAYGCLFFLEVFNGPDPVSMYGAAYACTAAFRTFEVPPQDSLHVVHALVAARASPQPPYGAGAPLPPGTYRIRTRMNADLADLEARVTVVDSVGAT